MERHPVPMSRLLRVARGAEPVIRRPEIEAPAPEIPVSRPRRLTLLGLAPLTWLAVVCALTARAGADRPDDGTA
ncbi:MAG: hypothetical protein JNK67_10425 [Alphaproteobacteria bacterium]|nr:hypothetical protein [Alphaproteobacteria bacterium]